MVGGCGRGAGGGGGVLAGAMVAAHHGSAACRTAGPAMCQLLTSCFVEQRMVVCIHITRDNLQSALDPRYDAAGRSLHLYIKSMCMYSTLACVGPA